MHAFPIPRHRFLTLLKIANLSLLLLFPVSWFAPLLRVRYLPLFGDVEISIITGLQRLWRSDVVLALIVSTLALFIPLLKTLGIALAQFDLLQARMLPVLSWLGKLAMADVFLIALYIVVARDARSGRIEPAWGIYLFTFCVLASLLISILTARIIKADRA